jgi:cytochrome c oxidase assembly protein subunit 15
MSASTAGTVLPAHDRDDTRLQALWLWGVVFMVVMMVVLGGLTRLTGSGLSMVEWRPLSLLPPLNDAQWAQTFAGYQTSPEFRLVNGDMTVDGFKSIYWLEYVHRLWGRLTGFVFALPLIAFAFRRTLSGKVMGRLVGILGLGAFQGVVGWLMVASGLVKDPHVSPYRLAAHLVIALAIFAALVWTALDLSAPSHVRHKRPTDTLPPIWRVVILALPVSIALTITWGALTAGLHAGLIYETFPLMDGDLFPADGLALSPAALNAVKNPATVQFLHRLLALSTLALLAGSVLAAWKAQPAVARALIPPALWVWAQAGLGIATLLTSVPVPLASAHQCGAVILLGLAVRSVHIVLHQSEVRISSNA